MEKLAANKPRQKKDLELWKQWDQGGRKPEDLRPLFSNFRGMIRSQANKYKTVELPPPAIEAAFKQQFVNALQTYNPNKGVAVGTWVQTNLRKGQRWVNNHQNMVRITESRSGKMLGQFNDAVGQLEMELDREPSDDEVADFMGISGKTATRLRNEQRRDLVGSEMVVDPIEFRPSGVAELMTLLPYDLTPQEKLVWEYSQGLNGRPKLDGNQIAKKLSVSPSTVSRLKKSIGQKAQVYLDPL